MPLQSSSGIEITYDTLLVTTKYFQYKNHEYKYYFYIDSVFGTLIMGFLFSFLPLARTL